MVSVLAVTLPSMSVASPTVGHAEPAATALSSTFCQTAANLSAHLVIASPYVIASPDAASLASAFPRHAAYLPAVLFFPAWHCWAGVPPYDSAAVASATSAIEVTRAQRVLESFRGRRRMGSPSWWRARWPEIEGTQTVARLLAGRLQKTATAVQD